MSLIVPRLRMFAGPNGSGKSTIKSLLPADLLGIYINPDEIQLQLQSPDGLGFDSYGVRTDEDEVRRFFARSTLIQNASLTSQSDQLSVVANRLHFPNTDSAAYLASVTADFIRQRLLTNQTSFTFETVMSSPDKVELLCKAQKEGFRTYLYYIATEDPSINVSRVRSRVLRGGHDVPSDKIASRYHRSLALLFDAIRCSNRTYVFDNSGTDRFWVAEVTDGTRWEMKSDSVPAWFKRSVFGKLKD